MNGLIEVSTKGTYTNLLQLFTGTAYIAIPEIEWRGDPFQDAVPCFLAAEIREKHRAKVWTDLFKRG